MKRRLYSFIATMTLVVFVNFMFMNTVFMHTHQGLDGRTVTHSHPYIPSSSHTHSVLSLDQIAGFNFAASSAQASSAIIAAAPFAGTMAEIVASYIMDNARHCCRTLCLRAPPVC